MEFNIGDVGDPVEITKENVIDYILDCKRILEEQPAQTAGSYWIVGMNRGRRKPGRRIKKRMTKKLFEFRKPKAVWRVF